MMDSPYFKRFLAGTVAVVASGFLCLAAFGADDNLEKLEDKFFHKTYAKDAMPARLDRLEKMVFGEVRQGSEHERLASLLTAVPNLSAPVDENGGPTTGPDVARGGNSKPGGRAPAQQQDDDSERSRPPVAGSSYPAVTAMERKMFGKDFASESVDQRLARLETKVFGKPSKVDDLSERVDRLKQSTGIDVARQAPAGSDWADEEDDDITIEPTPTARSGEDGRSFSGRNLRQDMQNAFGRSSGGGSGMYGGGGSTSYGGGSGMYGSGGGGRSSGGSGMYGAGNYGSSSRGTAGAYGMGGGSSSSSPPPVPRGAAGIGDNMPPTAPPRMLAGRPPVAAAPSGMGLNQQVSALEREIFGKVSQSDPLPSRVQKLEATIFPGSKPASDRPLPDRVNRLLGVVPLGNMGGGATAAPPPRVAQNPDPTDLGDDDDGNGPPVAPARKGGLGRIMNSISNFLMGGGGYVGGYPMAGGALITDPQTGLLLDQSTGNLIDPATGMVVGQRAIAQPRYGSGIGAYPPSFNNGFSPYGSMPFGGTGGGMRFGFGSGGFGMGGLGGIWP